MARRLAGWFFSFALLFHVRRGSSNSRSSANIEDLAFLSLTRFPRQTRRKTGKDALVTFHSPSPVRYLEAQARTTRKGLIESAVGGAVVFLAFLRPKTAPGVSERLQEKSEAAAKEVQAANLDVNKGASEDEQDTARARLRKALRRLAEVEAELDGAAKDQKDFPVPEYLQDFYGTGRLLLAVTGAAGVGKSSWVNAIRRMKDKETGAAGTGITETTLVPKVYGFSKDAGMFRQAYYRLLNDTRQLVSRSAREAGQQLQAFKQDVLAPTGDIVLLQEVEGVSDKSIAEVMKQLDDSHWEVLLEDERLIKIQRHQMAAVQAECVVWDLPGIGTPNYPQASYLRRMGVRYFDVVVLMTSSRFTEAELLLAEELRRFQVPFFLVRNKVDIDIESEIEKEEEDAGRELSQLAREEIARQTLSCIKAYFSSEYGLNDVYCISTKRKFREHYDFLRLERDIEEAVLKQRGSASAEASTASSTS